jgi:hypothetical protein
MHHLDENGDLIFWFLSTHTAKEVVNKFRKAIQAQPAMHALYLAQHPQLPDNYFKSAMIWDKIHSVSGLPDFERLYDEIESEYFLLWHDDVDQDGQCDLLIYTYLRYSWLVVPS